LSVGHHDPLADESDLLTLNEALIRIEDEAAELRRELAGLQQQEDEANLERRRHRLAVVEDAAERYRRLLSRGRS
jgi:hypothetical protein